MNVDDDHDFYGTCTEGAEEQNDLLECDIDESDILREPNAENSFIELQNYFASENYQIEVEETIYSANHHFDENYDFNAMLKNYEETTDKRNAQNKCRFNRVFNWLINEVHTEIDEFDLLNMSSDAEEYYQQNTLSNLELEDIFSIPRASNSSRNGSVDLFGSISEYEINYLNNFNNTEEHANNLKLISYDSSSTASFNWKEIKQNCNSPDLFDISDEKSSNKNSRNLLEDLELYSNLENKSKISEHENSSADSILQDFVKISTTGSSFCNAESVSSNSLRNNFEDHTQSNSNDEINSIELNWPNVVSNEANELVTIKTDLCEAILSDTADSEDFRLSVEEPASNLSLRQLELMEEIRNLINSLQRSLNQTGSAHLLVANTNWSNISCENSMLALNRNGSQRKISSSSKNNRFKIIMYLLSEIYILLFTGYTCNIRQLYYKDPELCKSPENVVNALKDICCYLNSSPWELKVLSTSKGLIAGPIRFITNDSEIIDCNNNLQYGTLIPYDVTNNFEIFDSDAKFILIVEKDTIFQKLLQHNVLTKLGEPFVLITGKGYPDMNTRLIIKKIFDKFNLPIFILVDGDPFGIEIMLTYKYGSKARAFNSQQLACPEIKWIGLLPSEIDDLSLPSVPFNCEDKKKLNALFRKPYLDEIILPELRYFSQIKRKAEIEALTELSVEYLIDHYLVKKIQDLI